MIDLNTMDKQRLLRNFMDTYDLLTKYSDNIEGLDPARTYGERLVANDKDFVEDFAKLRGNTLRNIREITALGFAVMVEQTLAG